MFAVILCSPLASKAEDWQDIEFHSGEKTFKLKDFQGKNVLIMFWATWCPYCKRQLPALSLLKKLYSNLDNFEVLPISIDEGGEEAVKNYMNGANIKNLDVYMDENSDLLHAFGFNAVPTLILISKDGVILSNYSGLQELDIKYLDTVLTPAE